MAAGYILVGGRSSRFGRDKALLKLEGQPLALRIADRMRPAVESLTLVGDPDKYGHLGLPVIPDALPDIGPMGGLVAALEDSPTEWTVISACDMPLVTTDLFRFLVARASESSEDVVLPYDREGRPEPLCAVYRSSTRQVFRRIAEGGVRKVMRSLQELSVLRLTPAEYASVDPDGLVFTNLNHPGDVEQAGLDIAAR